MKDKGSIFKFVLLGILVLILIVARVNYVIKSNVTTEGVTKYELLTSEQYESGDSANCRYEIDLEKKTIVKYEDYYDAQGKLVSKDSLVFQQTIGTKYKKTLEECIDKIVANWKLNGNTNKKECFTLVINGKKIRFHDEKIKGTLLKIME